ncbi:unnamed protein product [Pleuronectes platessa]|uniref:Uncharacterized protein n=1 Tax=Pleuronectes platessa TaxID=8262 RepID=A0A9N7VUU1_PLEPL|nr:unnamed protein product [Pleuronectes platessa]
MEIFDMDTAVINAKRTWQSSSQTSDHHALHIAPSLLCESTSSSQPVLMHTPSPRGPAGGPEQRISLSLGVTCKPAACCDLLTLTDKLTSQPVKQGSHKQARLLHNTVVSGDGWGPGAFDFLFLCF